MSHEELAKRAGWRQVTHSIFYHPAHGHWTESGGAGGNYWRALCDAFGIR